MIIVVLIFIILITSLLIAFYYQRKRRHHRNNEDTNNVQQETSEEEVSRVLEAQQHPLLTYNPTTQLVESENDLSEESLQFLKMRLPSYEETIRNIPNESPPFYEEEEDVV